MVHPHPTSITRPSLLMSIPTDLTTTASGLQYADVTVGTGAEATARTRVQVHYTGELTDGLFEMLQYLLQTKKSGRLDLLGTVSGDRDDAVGPERCCGFQDVLQ